MTRPVNPHRITIALDRAGLFGPTADAKLDAHEPDLDNWEAGKTQPTQQQLEKLAQLGNVPMRFFWLSDYEQPPDHRRTRPLRRAARLPNPRPNAWRPIRRAARCAIRHTANRG